MDRELNMVEVNKKTYDYYRGRNSVWVREHEDIETGITHYYVNYEYYHGDIPDIDEPFETNELDSDEELPERIDGESVREYRDKMYICNGSIKLTKSELRNKLDVANMEIINIRRALQNLETYINLLRKETI